MHVLAAYSRPRGILGRYVFTIMIYFSEPKETAQIEVKREETKYACDHCGRWASISTYEAIHPSEHRKIGTLELYRYDNVEPEDFIYMELKDEDLLWWQRHNISVLQDQIGTGFSVIPFRETIELQQRFNKDPLYEVMLLNWDLYGTKQRYQAGTMRVEEELIHKTMNAEQITITKLLLEPKGQPLQLTGQTQFIEGELRYLS